MVLVDSRQVKQPSLHTCKRIESLGVVQTNDCNALVVNAGFNELAEGADGV